MNSGIIHKYIGWFAGFIVLVLLGGIGALSYMLYELNHPKKDQVTSELVSPSVEGINTDTANAGTPSPQASTVTNSPSVSKGQTTNTYKPYVAGTCTKIPIPYKTTYINVSYLKVGETSSWGGTDGYKNVCTNDSNGLKAFAIDMNPIDKTVYVGTGAVTPTPPPQPTYTYAEALSLAQSNCSALGLGNSSAWQQCVDAYMRKFGY